MKVEINSTSACKKDVVIEVPSEQVSLAFNQALAQFARFVSVPGFRPGRAPQNIVRARYAKELRDEVIRTMVPQVVQNALVENNLPVVGEPVVDHLHLTDGQPLTVKLKVEVIPEVELGEYRGLAATKRMIPVTDEAIDRALEKMRESQASLLPTEDDHAAEDGNFAEFSLMGYELAEGEDTPQPDAAILIPQHVEEMRLGSETAVPAFNDNLRGMKMNETREFIATFDEKSNAPQELQGKRVFCRVEMQTIRVQELPDLDDGFAQGLPGDFESLDDLRSKIRARFERESEQLALTQVQDNLLDQLVKQTQIEAPDVLVQDRAKERLQMLAESLIQRGLDPRVAQSFDWNALLEEQVPLARRDIQHTLLLSKIGNAENIDATEEEINHEISHIASHNKMSPAALKDRLTKEGGLASIRAAIRHKKTLQFLVDNANLTTETVTPANDQSASAES
ncbi:MAG: trigger factor [Blastocatellia bacterium]|nr:trigger factor [Blastocatellia bacterium]